MFYHIFNYCQFEIKSIVTFVFLLNMDRFDVEFGFSLFLVSRGRAFPFGKIVYSL